MLIKEVVILRSRDLEPSQKAVRIRHAGRKELMLRLFSVFSLRMLCETTLVYKLRGFSKNKLFQKTFVKSKFKSVHFFFCFELSAVTPKFNK